MHVQLWICNFDDDRLRLFGSGMAAGCASNSKGGQFDTGINCVALTDSVWEH
jgi:hypothetical protein